MYWHKLENLEDGTLLKSALNEYKNIHSKNKNNSTWYSNILFYSEKLGVDLSSCKTISKYKLKLCLKSCIRNNFLDIWNGMQKLCIDGIGKLSTYFKFKSSFDFENYLCLKNK